MTKQNYPMTQAVRFLKSKNIPFQPYLYQYEEHGGTRVAAQLLNVPEHAVIKTLVMADETGQPFLVLMHGDCEVSTKQLARIHNVKRVTPCDPDVAHKHTGYLVGGISPFGTRTQLPIYAETTIFALEKIYINGGKRGFLVEIAPGDLRKALLLQEVTIAIQS
jgi:Cys-tRNA(Pro) deacylase